MSSTQFKKMSFWNKVAALGSIASIIGFSLAFFPSRSVEKKTPQHEPQQQSSIPISIDKNIKKNTSSNINQGVTLGNVTQEIHQDITITQPKAEETEVQVIRSPEVEHNDKYEITRIDKIINDTSYLNNNSFCLDEPFEFTAMIVKRVYEADNARIIGIVTKENDGSRGYVNIDKTLYDRLDRVDGQLLQGFLVEGSRRIFSVYACGASGQVLDVDSIAIESHVRSSKTH